MLGKDFFDRDALIVARDLIGKVIRRKYQSHWLSAQIIETEAYYISEKGSHASLGRSPSREPLFMPSATIYMYYARGGDSLNVSCRGAGNAVLVKSAYPYFDRRSPQSIILPILQRLNPHKSRAELRSVAELCSGQTLLCKALDLRVPEWSGKNFSAREFFIEDRGYVPARLVQAQRLGIPPGRDEHLPYRWLDYAFAAYVTQNPLTKRAWQEGKEFTIHPS